MENSSDPGSEFLNELLYTFSGFTYVVHGILLLVSAVLLFLLSILYKNIRKRFPVTVNCWFCNNYTRVPYELSNSWDCPHCKQYNGFNADGGYNKVIKEQYNSKLNDEVFNTLKKPFSSSKSNLQTNGFCKLCNINQQLKIQQLALFVPIDENNYYEEIEKYRDKLEKAYKLCSQCEKTLKETLEKQEYNLLQDRLNGHKQSSFLQKPKTVINRNGREFLIYLKKNGVQGLRWICFVFSMVLFLALIVQLETEHQLLYLTLPDIAILEPLEPISKVGLACFREIYNYSKELSFVGFVCCLLTHLERKEKRNEVVLLVWGLVHILFWSELTKFQAVMAGVSLFLNGRAVQNKSICLSKKSLPRKSGFQPVKQIFPQVCNLSGEGTWPKAQSGSPPSNFSGSTEESPAKENTEANSRSQRMKGKSRRRENEVEVPASEDGESQEPRTAEASPGSKSTPSGPSVFSKQFLSTLEGEKNEEAGGSFSEVYNGLNGLSLGAKQKKAKPPNFLFSSPNLSEARSSASIIKPAKLIKNMSGSWTCTESNECGSRSSTPSSGYSSQKPEKTDGHRYDFAKTLSPISVNPFGRHSPQECFDYYGGGGNGFYNNFNYCSPPGFVPFQQLHSPVGHTTIYTCTRPTNFPFPFPWQGFPPNQKLSPGTRFSDASDCDNLFQNASRSLETNRKWFKLKTFSYYLSVLLNLVTLLGLGYLMSTGIILVDWKLPQLNFAF